MPPKRPKVRVRFKYDTDTGEIVEFIVDDNAPSASEDYHLAVARTVAERLGRNIEIEDAGAVRLSDDRLGRVYRVRDTDSRKEEQKRESKGQNER